MSTSGRGPLAAQTWNDIRSVIELMLNSPSLSVFQGFVQALNEFD